MTHPQHTAQMVEVLERILDDGNRVALADEVKGRSGGFGRALAEALYMADTKNAKRLVAAFPEVFYEDAPRLVKEAQREAYLDSRRAAAEADVTEDGYGHYCDARR